MRFVQSIQNVEATTCSRVRTQPSTEIRAYPPDPSSRCRGFFKWSEKCDQSVFTLLLVAHCLLLCFSAPLSLSLSPSWSIHREKCSTLPPFQWFHPAFAPVSMFTISCDFCLFETAARFNSCAIPGTSCCGVRDPWSVEYQSCELAMFLQHRSRDWLRSDISTNFRCEHLS